MKKVVTQSLLNAVVAEAKSLKASLNKKRKQAINIDILDANNNCLYAQILRDVDTLNGEAIDMKKKHGKRFYEYISRYTRPHMKYSDKNCFTAIEVILYQRLDLGMKVAAFIKGDRKTLVLKP